MKILVLGGTGAMGKHIVELLARANINTVVTSRSYHCSEGPVRFIQGNAQDMSFLRALLLQEWDAIIDFMVYTTSAFEKRIDFLLGATNQYVFLSSARVYADSTGRISEESPRLLDVSKDKEFLSTDDYSLTKARQEDILKCSGKSNWTIIRPYITYSENRLQLGVLEKEEWLYRAIQGRTIVFSSDIKSRLTTMTYGLDVAKGIMSIVGNTDASGETFHITSEESIAWGNVLNIYLNALEKHLGRMPRVLFLNKKEFMDSKPEKYQIEYDRLFDRLFVNSKISTHIDVSSFTQVTTGLEKSIDYFLHHRDFNWIDWRMEALRDRQAKEHASLREIPGRRKKIEYLMFRYFPRFFVKKLMR